MSEFDELNRPVLNVACDDDRGALIALSGLPGISPKRLWHLLSLGQPAEVWRLVCSGKTPRSSRVDNTEAWQHWACNHDASRLADVHDERGVVVMPYGHPQYPDALLDDLEPPAVLYRSGPAVLDDRVRVAIVGTRTCSGYGRDVARQLGAGLAKRGVDVVSGLAVGVDAAAHAGAAEIDAARMVAVVAGGVDVIYPRRNAGLYRTVATGGALLSEWPLGAQPRPWRFPARNRLVAALTAATVVVESAEKGGSLYTVDEALRRDRAVYAVPGPIYSPLSAGTNRLIADGAYALVDVDDFLDVLAPRSGPRAVQIGLGIDSWVLEAIGWQPMALDALVAESGRTAGEVTLEVERLLGVGAVRRLGGMIERAA